MTRQPLLLAALAACACAVRRTRCSRRWHRRDGALELVVSETTLGALGATVSQPYNVFIVTPGKSASNDDLVMRIDQAEPPRVRWLDARHGVIECDAARVWSYTDFATPRVNESEFITASIALRCGADGVRQ